MKPAPGLEQLLADQRNPSSPEYRKWLTPEQFAERFGLSPNDTATLTAWLQSQGLRVDRVARGRHWITFSGSVDRVNRAFDAEIHRYEMNGEIHLANAADISVPEALSPVVEGIEGLSDFGIVPMHVKPLLNIGNSRYLAPDDFATIYNTKPLYDAGFDGRDQSIAVVGRTTINLSDIRAFRNRFNLPANDPQLVLGGANPGRGSDGDFVEANLDVQWAGAIAPNAKVIYVYSTSIPGSLQYAVDQNLAPVITMSYGGCEQTFGTRDRYIAQQANAQGITWLVASGDWGAATCDLFAPTPQASKGLTVAWPASTPEVTAVGGTRLNANGSPYWSATNNPNGGSALSYIPERAWNDSAERGDLAAGGGGASVLYSKPVWQTGPGVPSDNARDVPDVSFASSPNFGGYQIIVGGSTIAIGGTSAASPAFAGILALVNQYLVANGVIERPGLGNINPMLYRLAQTTSDVFHDVTVGNIKVPCSQGSPNCQDGLLGHDAGPGYDLATGLGSVDAHKLATSWTLGPGTRTTVTATPGNPALEENVEIKAAVAGNGSVTPTGTVTFSTNGAVLGTVPLSDGVAALTVPALQIGGGNGTIAAAYSGDALYDASAGNAAITLRVPPGASAVIPFVTPNPVHQNGTSWSFTVRLSEKAGVATKLTGFSIDGDSSVLRFFSTTDIAANGTVSTPSLTATIAAARNRVFTFTGVDADGRTWTRELTVPFVGPAGPTLEPSMTLVSTPGAVPRNPQADAACQWSHQLTVQEQSGYTMLLTGLTASGVSLTGEVQRIFGTTRLAPFGSLQGTVCWTSQVASRTYQLTGASEEGRTVSASVTTSFAGPPASPSALSTDVDSVTMTAASSSETVTGAIKVNLAAGDWRVTPLPANRTTSWLSVTPLAGSGPGELTIRASATGLSKGVYRALLAVQSGDTLPQSITVPVTLVVGASSTARIAGASNNFSGGAAFAPGMLTSIYGTQLAPSSTFLAARGLPLPLTMAGVSATVNGISAPLYFVSPGQINLQIPYEAGSGPAVLAIHNNGEIAHFPLRIGMTAPGIATAPGGSIGAGRPGQAAVLYVTGDGDVTPSLATGASAPPGTPISRLPRPRQFPTLTVAGIDATVAFAGIPSWGAGVTQINFTVPPNTPAGVQPVIVTVGGVAGQTATIEIQ